MVIYLATLNPGLDRGDAAELQYACPLAGVCHNPGYQIEVAFRWLFNKLPLGGQAAWRINLMMAVCGTVGALCRCRRGSLCAQELPGGFPGGDSPAGAHAPEHPPHRPGPDQRPFPQPWPVVSTPIVGAPISVAIVRQSALCPKREYARLLS